jgi:hypothetical protein
MKELNMLTNFQSDDSSDDSSTCCGSGSDSSVTNSMSRNSSSSVVVSHEESFRTPAPEKKKIRRTNAQIQADKAAKEALKLVNGTTGKKSGAKPKSVSSSAQSSISAAESTINIDDEVYTLQAARTIWSTDEQMDLLWSYKTWEDGAKMSQNKKLIPINKLWLTHIPKLMGKKFGRVRPTPNNVLANSPYQYKWLAIRKKVSD